MAKKGRPGKGDRTFVTSRLPAAQAKLVYELAIAAGMNRSDFIHALVTVALRHVDELPQPVESPEELPLTS